MQYGKIYIENGELIFKKRMIENSLPCRDILWAYRDKSEEGKDPDRTIAVSVCTRRKKHYRFEMTVDEAEGCLRTIKKESPDTVIGFPKEKNIPTESISFLRDLGTTLTEDGRMVLPGRLLRGGCLYHLSRSDQEIFDKVLGVKTIVDLRSDQERDEKPDVFLRNVEYIKNQILFDEDEKSIFLRKSDYYDRILSYEGEVEEEIRAQYRNLVLDDGCMHHYAQLFDAILDQPKGAIFWHCSDGKDRSAVGAALLLAALGVPYPRILADYMETDRTLEEERVYMLRYFQSRQELTPLQLHNVQAVHSVQEGYLREVFLAIDEEFGSMESYLHRQMYLSPKALEELKERYLV